MDFTFLSGGTGTPKLLQGFRKVINDDQITVICNTGDDYLWYGLHISPDLDTVLYLFSERLDTDKFWGVTDDTFSTINTLKTLGEDVWFNVGNKDLGLHIFRTNMLKNHSLTKITEIICNNWEISAQILPMCNQNVFSTIDTDQGLLKFQEYFVKYRWKPKVENVEYVGNKDYAPESVLSALDRCDHLIIGPSNPITSIGPILSIKAIREKIELLSKKVIVISPMKGNKVYSGPTALLMDAMGYEMSPIGLAQFYEGLVSHLILDPSDKIFKDKIIDLGIEPIFHSIDLLEQEQKTDLASFIINQI